MGWVNEKDTLVTVEMCTECGTEMFVLTNPDAATLQASGGYEQLKRILAELDYDIETEQVRMAFCSTCEATALLGPEVMFSGTIVETEED